MLTSPEACEFLVHCKQTGRKILLPEVIEEELRYQYLKALVGCAEEIRNNNETLVALVGKWNELRYPTPEEMRAAINERLALLEPYLQRSSLLVEHSRDALRRTIHRVPPASANGEQFRDCLIWAAVIGDANPVVELVTGDHVFYEKKDGDLHPVLRREATEARKNVRAFRHLTNLMSTLGDDPETRRTALLTKAMVAAYAQGAVSGYADRVGLKAERGGRMPEVQLFATEIPGRLMAEYSVSEPLEPTSADGPSQISMRGSVYVRLSKDVARSPGLDLPEFEDPKLIDEVIVTDKRGEEVKGLSARWVSGSSAAELVMREHRVRRPISSDVSIDWLLDDRSKQRE